MHAGIPGGTAPFICAVQCCKLRLLRASHDGEVAGSDNLEHSMLCGHTRTHRFRINQEPYQKITTGRRRHLLSCLSFHVLKSRAKTPLSGLASGSGSPIRVHATLMSSRVSSQAFESSHDQILAQSNADMGRLVAQGIGRGN